MRTTFHQVRRRVVLPALGLALAIGALGLGTAAVPTAHAEQEGKGNKPCPVSLGFGATASLPSDTKIPDGDGHYLICIDGYWYSSRPVHEQSAQVPPAGGAPTGRPIATVGPRPGAGVLSPR